MLLRIKWMDIYKVPRTVPGTYECQLPSCAEVSQIGSAHWCLPLSSGFSKARLARATGFATSLSVGALLDSHIACLGSDCLGWRCRNVRWGLLGTTVLPSSHTSPSQHPRSPPSASASSNKSLPSQHPQSPLHPQTQQPTAGCLIKSGSRASSLCEVLCWGSTGLPGLPGVDHGLTLLFPGSRFLACCWPQGSIFFGPSRHCLASMSVLAWPWMITRFSTFCLPVPVLGSPVHPLLPTGLTQTGLCLPLRDKKLVTPLGSKRKLSTATE